jgi:SSS family solute:Na+ symporter
LGLFWKRANETGAIAGAIASVGLSWLFKVWLPGVPFLDRMGIVFLLSFGLAVGASLFTAPSAQRDTIEAVGVSFVTRRAFNVGGIAVLLILVALYATFW